MRAIAVAVLLCSLTAACVPNATEDDINASLEGVLRSVAGDWTGVSTGSGTLRLDFRLQEGSNGQVSGSGTMTEGTSAPVPITVTGTFQRPLLTLTFAGMMYAGRSVQGTVTGSYTTVGGIMAPLQLTATGYAQSVQMLLQEK